MQKSSIYFIVIIGLLVLILVLDRCSGEKEPKVENVYNTYTTDTTYVDKTYKTLLSEIRGLQERLKPTPAKEVIYYQTPDPETITIEKIPDSILVYIGELEERLAISDTYLKNYPESDKLIDFQLTKDLFNITTLSIGGTIMESKIPLYLNEYDYYWDNNSLYHEKREYPHTIPKTDVWNQLYIELGYDLLQQAPRAGLDYNVRMDRLKLSTGTYTLFHTNGIQLYGNVRLGYRLLK